MNPQQNAERVRKLIAEVEEHPMCAKFEFVDGLYRVLYPVGFYPNGAQASIGEGRAVALQRLLQVMERHWKENGIK